MTYRTRKRRGFTLIELLVSSAIFAIIMVVVAGTFSQANSYEGKVMKMRAVNEISMQVADQITRDVREAKGNIPTDSNKTSTWRYDSGLILLFCDASGCTQKYHDYPGTTYNANTLVLFSPAFYKIYYSTGGALYYKQVDGVLDLNSIITQGDIQSMAVIQYRLPTQKLGKIYDVNATFGGFAPNVQSSIQQQPYINFKLNVKTQNYDISLPGDRAEANLQSSVTLRSY